MANKTFAMLNRLERAILPTQSVRFSDFLNFICQPNPVKYAQQFTNEGEKKPKPEVQEKYQLSKSDIDQLWTAEDQKTLSQVVNN